MTLRRTLRAIFHPKVILPVLLTAALLAVALNLGDVGKVMGRVQAIPVWVMAVALAMAVAYLAIKCWQLHILLRHIGLHPGWHRLVLAFSVGELTVTLPFGIFAQNWVLSTTGRSKRSSFGRSSAATVAMLLIETVVVLLFLAVIGIPHWPQLRTVAALFAFGLVLLAWLALRFGHRLKHLHGRMRHPVLRKTFNQVIDLVNSLEKLYDVRLAAVNILAAAAYLGALAFAFMMVGYAMGVPHLNFLTAATIYAFSLAVVLMFGGLLSQIGTVEVVGMGAAHVWGISLTDGLALMLGFRVVWTGAIWLVNLPLVFVLWRTLKRPKAQPAPEAITVSAKDLKKASD
ncbi:MAG: lysylphosphatidylglycerol synthase domain-containing protein [Gammaproteobacteria bacterium]